MSIYIRLDSFTERVDGIWVPSQRYWESVQGCGVYCMHPNINDPATPRQYVNPLGGISYMWTLSRVPTKFGLKPQHVEINECIIIILNYAKIIIVRHIYN
jgi:hypothetical protein